jgi:hypothetical protein
MLNIKYTATRPARFSVRNFDPIWLEKEETATIIGWHVADGVNPLYAVKRDRDGATKAIYRRDLMESGVIDGADN